ncbi:hypothetical protein LUZ60_016235 [Juncus effusus]|nr:hypothetical protein LUZ60_016235 [Juncus effusus]
MTIARADFGTIDEMFDPSALKSALAELISTFIFVFAGQGSSMTFNKLTDNDVNTPTSLIASALANAFSFFVAVSMSTKISGGHVNPAITFGVFIGGKINLVRSLMYWLAQLIGSTFACLLLRFCTSGADISTFDLSGVDFIQALSLEAVLTFGLVFTVYVTTLDPTRNSYSVIAPIAIGFIVGANILVGGAFDGASMNPAVSFGPALINWSWENQWIYWAGPLAGSAVAGLAYQIFF